MINLQGKKILLAITGSIAAYKAAYLTRLLIKSGAEVQVLMTESAKAFISPLTLSTLSQNPVFTEVISDDSWNSHVDMGLWSDIMLVAPATAATLSRMASGLSDNLVVAVYLSNRSPVFFAPAMDVDMWNHPSTQNNIQILQQRGDNMIPVGHGDLASGLVGDGRMAEPEQIVRVLQEYFSRKEEFIGRRILVTAGPTFEPIDPVRFIGNRSSGKMGIAIADVFAKRGAQVTLVLGPSELRPKHSGIEVVLVETAQQMYEAALQQFETSDIAILAAAVADYRPKVVASSKIKKNSVAMTVELEKTPDIAASLGAIKRTNQLAVGFALETDNEEANAKKKLQKKNFDFIVLNSLRDKGAGFNCDTNKITILHKDNKIKKFELKSKSQVAEDIVNEVTLHFFSQQ